MIRENKDSISAEEAMELLQKDGFDVDLQQAQIIASFLYEMAEIVVSTYLYQQKNVNLPTNNKAVKQTLKT